ncbi:MAG: transcriptional regulator [Pseudooceanicola sp.]|jgi:DNA-binding MarR family transcriptional regulator|nr:transcriptional regulator [Pseudooceanicola sp.]
MGTVQGAIRADEPLVEPDELRGSVSYRIRLLQIAAYKSFETVLAGFGTAPRYYGMLRIIQANPGIAQTRLAEAIFLDRSSLVPILDSMTRDGWIERRATPRDKRVRRVFLTPAGAQMLDRLGQEVARHEAMMTAGLDGAEVGTLIGLLNRVDGNLRAALANAAKPAPQKGATA